ncbi:ArsR family transcriptional regulator [Paenibacillus maysiensis]|uniref:ArsR family transcriptional regulator n=1 Tax=Paenibacillus maysiensis TaxID=1155954 RepID=UPI001FD7B685|nr:ArsR family transcriptional regulator [Paenibacillus maysiensis]
MEEAQLAGFYNNKLFLQYARIGKCLSSERRLEILHILSNEPRSAENIVHATNRGVASISRHLQVLLDANLLQTFYSLCGKYVNSNYSILSKLRNTFQVLK